jgi:uncharacterized protein YwgA
MPEKLAIRDYILLGYKAFDGSVRGKTMLQKRMYFLSVILNVDLGFGPHYYGPYSSAVASANIELKSLGFLQGYSAGWGVDHRGFEMARYDYFLSEEGKEFADAKAEVNAEIWYNVQKAAEVIKKAGDLNYMELSIAAKAYFALTKLRGSASLDEIHDLLPQFGWNISKEELEKATSFLEKAGLVTNS